MQIGPQCTAVVEEIAGGDRVNCLLIASIGNLDPIGWGIGDIKVLVVTAWLNVAAVVEIHQIGNTLVHIVGRVLIVGTVGDITVFVGQQVTVMIEHFEAVGACGTRLEMVLLIDTGGGSFSNRDSLLTLARRKSQGADGLSEVFSGDSREAHGAVVHSLGARRIAAGNGECVAWIRHRECARPRCHRCEQSCKNQ